MVDRKQNIYINHGANKQKKNKIREKI